MRGVNGLAIPCLGMKMGAPNEADQIMTSAGGWHNPTVAT
jgi:hypothetical protein